MNALGSAVRGRVSQGLDGIGLSRISYDTGTVKRWFLLYLSGGFEWWFEHGLSLSLVLPMYLSLLVLRFLVTIRHSLAT